MHYERENLPADVREIFFSDVFFYAASVEPVSGEKPAYVGSGKTREWAIANMRRLAQGLPELPDPEPTLTAPIEGRTLLNEEQRAALATNLRRLREVRGLSQLQVARDVLGLVGTHAFVSRLEQRQLASVETQRLAKLATFFDVSPTALVTAPPEAR